MESRLFGRTEAEKKIREVIKARALLACTKERANLTTCFKNSWLGWCSEEQKAFWNCYNKVCVQGWLV